MRGINPQMLPGIVIFTVGVGLGYGVREIISRRRRKMYRDGRLRDRRSEDRVAQTEIDEDLGIAPGKSEHTQKAKIKATNEDAHS